MNSLAHGCPGVQAWPYRAGTRIKCPVSALRAEETVPKRIHELSLVINEDLFANSVADGKMRDSSRTDQPEQAGSWS